MHVPGPLGAVPHHCTPPCAPLWPPALGWPPRVAVCGTVLPACSVGCSVWLSASRCCGCAGLPETAAPSPRRPKAPAAAARLWLRVFVWPCLLCCAAIAAAHSCVRFCVPSTLRSLASGRRASALLVKLVTNSNPLFLFPPLRVLTADTCVRVCLCILCARCGCVAAPAPKLANCDAGKTQGTFSKLGAFVVTLTLMVDVEIFSLLCVCCHCCCFLSTV